MKNSKTKCEGLSPAFFFFAMCGNITYSFSIVAKSTDWDYLITNASWLAGAYRSTEAVIWLIVLTGSSLIVSLDIFVSG